MIRKQVRKLKSQILKNLEQFKKGMFYGKEYYKNVEKNKFL